MVIVCETKPAPTCWCFSPSPSLRSTHWAVVLVGGWTEAALCFSLPSINLCHKSVRPREKELLNTDLSAINLTSITRLGYCVLYYGRTKSPSHTEHCQACVSCWEHTPTNFLGCCSTFCCAHKYKVVQGPHFPHFPFFISFVYLYTSSWRKTRHFFLNLFSLEENAFRKKFSYENKHSPRPFPTHHSFTRSTHCIGYTLKCNSQHIFSSAIPAGLWKMKWEAAICKKLISTSPQRFFLQFNK